MHALSTHHTRLKIFGAQPGHHAPRSTTAASSSSSATYTAAATHSPQDITAQPKRSVHRCTSPHAKVLAIKPAQERCVLLMRGRYRFTSLAISLLISVRAASHCAFPPRLRALRPFHALTPPPHFLLKGGVIHAPGTLAPLPAPPRSGSLPPVPLPAARPSARGPRLPRDRRGAGGEHTAFNRVRPVVPESSTTVRTPQREIVLSTVGEATLDAINASLASYHKEWKIFKESGVVPNGFCLPAFTHTLPSSDPRILVIQEFGAPNGLCSSITESKHIKAVKEPWRQSSYYEVLIQMLTINDHLDKLAAACINFTDRGMLLGPSARALSPAPEPPPEALQQPMDPDDDDEGYIDTRDILGEVKLAKTPVCSYPRDPNLLAHCLRLPSLPSLIRCFLHAQAFPDLEAPLDDIPIDDCPDLPCSVKVFPSAVATFCASSDQSDLGSMFHEGIRAVRSWWGGAPRYDCLFVEQDLDQPGFRGLLTMRHNRIEFPCALVTWFSAIGDRSCPDVGMWMVEPDVDHHGQRMLDIIHIDTILRGAHLIGIYGEDFLPRYFPHSASLDRFKAFYINKYADHHSHEIVL
ncbi:hypothetical protein C8J57DRAFT_1473545 [Mycena rebaudengoi]|nr:hypothetical protein C8J57DRAFT_1473545 [Mycena rebaudengoi]